MKTAPEKQAEGSLTLAKEGPEPEAMRSANQINEINVDEMRMKQRYNPNLRNL